VYTSFKSACSYLYRYKTNTWVHPRKTWSDCTEMYCKDQWRV